MIEIDFGGFFMAFETIKGDITRMKVDAIVNAANTQLLEGGGVCGAIFRAAGAVKLRAACNRVAPIRTGEAVATAAFDLDAKIIIHTAGPIRRGGAEGEVALLRNCYTNSLKLAREKGCKSIAFPLISSGIFGVPYEIALDCARTAIEKFLSTDDSMSVYLVLFGG